MSARSCHPATLFAIGAIISIVLYTIYNFRVYGTWPSLVEICSQLISSCICCCLITFLCISNYGLIAWIIAIVLLFSSSVTSVTEISTMI